MTDYYVEEDYDDAFDDGDEYDYYDPDELDPDGGDVVDEIEGRTSWMYLGLMSAVFVLLVLFSWACADRSPGPGETMVEEQTDAAAGESVELTVAIDGDIVVMRGAVPDEAARQQIVEAAGSLYGPQNVIDELALAETATFDGATLLMSGRAVFDDDRPSQLRDRLSSDFGLSSRQFDIDRGDAAPEPVAVQAQLANDGTIALAGAVPDRQSITDLTAAAEAVWGPGSVDVSALTVVSDATWIDGSVLVAGTALPGDQRIDGFPAQVQQRFGPEVAVDISGVQLDFGPEGLGILESQLAEQVLASPIRFAPTSAVIEPESEAILQVVVDTLARIPEVEVEVVGHTDDEGIEAENQVLSEQRAEAVVARLGELGVDVSRLTARGEGQSQPLVPNDSDENREQNRRIEFRIVGAG
jgi:outer membrane protein OmpA-like peptidoglycan-associated protein